MLISGVKDENIATAIAALEAIGISDQRDRDPRRACRLHRQQGCRFAASDTKGHAEDDRRALRGARTARQPGQYPSHRLPSLLRAALYRRYRSIGARVATSEEGDTVDGYNILVGGGFGPDAALGSGNLSRCEGRHRPANR